MTYTVYLHKGIYYQTELNPGDKLKRIEFRDSFRSTHIWVKDVKEKPYPKIKPVKRNGRLIGFNIIRGDECEYISI